MGMMQSYTYNGGFSQNMENFYNTPHKSQPPKISAWIDIQCEITPVPFSDISQAAPANHPPPSAKE